jgi:ribosome-binding protein aMBF1 (putative translation factor)
VWTLTGQPGRSESCHQCGSDLRVCLNCAHFDARSAHQCKDRRAEPVFDKHMANYCEWFEMVRRPWAAQKPVETREQAARDTLKKLFGD